MKKNIIAKLKESTRLSEKLKVDFEDYCPSLNDKLKAIGASIKPLISDYTHNEIISSTIQAMEVDSEYMVEIEEAIQIEAPYKFRLDKFDYFLIEAESSDAKKLMELLLDDPSIELAYEEYSLEKDLGDTTFPDPPAAKQEHLGPAPRGINARFAQSIDGGMGECETFIDIEQGWQLNHPDLAEPGSTIPLIFGDIFSGFRNHGTSVLGTICSKRSVVGIVPKSRPIVISHYNEILDTDTFQFDAIIEAIKILKGKPGSVLLLEMQAFMEDGREAPIEVNDKEYAAIRLATGLDIVVVECGGNWGHNLDNFSYQGKKVFDRNHRDSGAIIVSAATAEPEHTRMKAPFGKRIDCYAWGEKIVTTAYYGYREDFGGTSGAGAIIAGAAIAVQGIGKKHFTGKADRGYFRPREMRAILSNCKTGTPPSDGSNIGVMPDLKRIIEHMKKFESRKKYINEVKGQVEDRICSSCDRKADCSLARPTVS